MITEIILASTLSTAIVAHGGERLEHLRSVVVEWGGESYLIGDSRAPEPPWDRAPGWHGFAIEMDTRISERHLGAGGGYFTSYSVQADAAGSAIINDRRLSRRETDETTYAERLIGFGRYLPPLMVRELLRRGHESEFGASRCSGTATRTTRVEAAGPPQTIHFDPEWRLVCIETSFTDYDGTTVPVRHEFSEFETRSGILMPHVRETHMRGELSQRFRLLRFDAGVDVAPFFRDTGEYREVGPVAEDERAFRVEEIADGVWFVGEGVMFQLFVEVDDYLVALDSSSGDVERRIDAIRERVPGKPVRYVLASHHHADHLHGLDEFVALGATVLASPEHVDIIRSQPGVEDADIEVVDDTWAVEGQGGAGVVVSHVGPFPHSDSMLIAWLPRSRTLFTADLFVLGRRPVGVAQDNAVALHGILSERGWDIDRIVDPHSATIATMDDLEAAVSARAAGRRSAWTDRIPWTVRGTLPRDGTAYEDVEGVESIYGDIETTDGYRLRTIVTRPAGVSGPLPLVHFVQWLSCDTVEIRSSDDGWTQMLRGLVRSGYAVSRVEKAGVGDSEGPSCAALDYDTELRHHREALTAFRALPGIDSSRVAVFGASMGATMAPLVAEEAGVSGVMAWGGGAVTWLERLLAFDRNALELSGADPETVAAKIGENARFYEQYLLQGMRPSLIATADPELGAVWPTIIGTDGDTHYGRPVDFHQQAQKHDWYAAWSEVDVPVLVLYGEYDWFETERAHRSIVHAVESGGGSAEMYVIPGMDHHFTVYRTRRDAFTERGGKADAGPVVIRLRSWLERLFGRVATPGAGT